MLVRIAAASNDMTAAWRVLAEALTHLPNDPTLLAQARDNLR